MSLVPSTSTFKAAVPVALGILAVGLVFYAIRATNVPVLTQARSGFTGS